MWPPHNLPCRRGPAILIALLGYSLVVCAQTDKYGGSEAIPCSGGVRPHFYTEKIADHWWLCTPAGNAFWSVGIYNATIDSETDRYGVNVREVIGAKYGFGYSDVPVYRFYERLIPRLQSWGWNTIDMYAIDYLYPWNVGWPAAGPDGTRTIPNKIPGIFAIKPTYLSLFNYNNTAPGPVKNLIAGTRKNVYAGWPGGMADYFDRNYSVHLSQFLGSPPRLQNDYILGVCTDESDFLYWSGAGSDFPTFPPGKANPHAGWMTFVTSPLQYFSVFWFNNAKLLYTDPLVYTKVALRDFLANRYGDIEALNAAWGSSYTLFDSTGTRMSQQLAVGDDATTTFATTLLLSPSAWSVALRSDGVLMAGDDGKGTVGGPAVASGSIDYDAKSLVVTFAKAPPSGTVLTIDYVACGYGCGTGLLDEDGTHAFAPVNDIHNILSRNSSSTQEPRQYEQMVRDLDDFLFEYAAHYFKLNRDAITKQWGADYLYLGPSSIGSWGSPARAPVYRAAAAYVDVLRVMVPDSVGTVDFQNRFDFIAANVDKPWTAWVGATACPENYFSPNGCSSPSFSTQAERAKWYAGATTYMIQGLQNGTRHFVGLNFWELFDNRREVANWGVLTRLDNAYDGVEAVRTRGDCSPVLSWNGIPYPCGGERNDYGAFLTPGVIAAHRSWMPVPADAPASARRSSDPVRSRP